MSPINMGKWCRRGVVRNETDDQRSGGGTNMAVNQAVGTSEIPGAIVDCEHHDWVTCGDKQQGGNEGQGMAGSVHEGLRDERLSHWLHRRALVRMGQSGRIQTVPGKHTRGVWSALVGD